MPTFTETVARYCTQESHRPPQSAIETAKWILLDEIGNMVIGRRLPPGKVIADYVIDLGGQQESAVVGRLGARVPAAAAALANATSIHADELDGTHVTEGHPSASIVASAFAVADRQGASGEALLNAIILGYDIGTRLVEAAGGRRSLIKDRHVHSDFLHTYGCAAAAGSLLGLSTAQMRHAFALAGAWAPATPAVFFSETRHMSKALNCGIVAYGGTSAALLAARGFEGSEDVFGAVDGVSDVWMGGEIAERWFGDLGQRYAIADSNFKFFSAGYPIHAPLRASLDLLETHGLGHEDIAEIEVRMTTNSAEIVDRRSMPSICLQDMMSVGLVHGRLGFHEAHDESLLEREPVARLRTVISVVADSSLDAENPRGRGAVVHLRAKNGAEFIREQKYPPGHCMAADTTWEALVQKFNDNVEGFLSTDQAATLAATVLDLETGASVQQLVAACQP